MPTPFHWSRAWKRLRRVTKIEAGFKCEECGRFLPEKHGLHVHHRKPVTQAPALGLEPLNLMTLCPGCHSRLEPRGATLTRRFACNDDGTPTDPDHPWNVGGARSKS